MKLYKGWDSPVYRISKQIFSQEVKSTTNQTGLNEEDFFKDKPVRFILSEGCSYIPVSDISKALDLSYSNMHNMINRNKESFSGQIKMIKYDSGREIKCVNQEGLINLLLSISSSRLTKNSRSTVIKFRKWSVSKLNQLIVVGTVILTPEEHVEVKKVVSDSIGSTLEDLEKIFSDVNQKFDIFAREFSKAHAEFAQVSNQVSKIQESNKELRVKNEYLSERNNYLINNVQQLQQKITDTFVRSGR